MKNIIFLFSMVLMYTSAFSQIKENVKYRIFPVSEKGKKMVSMRTDRGLEVIDFKPGWYDAEFNFKKNGDLWEIRNGNGSIILAPQSKTPGTAIQCGDMNATPGKFSIFIYPGGIYAKIGYDDFSLKSEGGKIVVPKQYESTEFKILPVIESGCRLQFNYLKCHETEDWTGADNVHPEGVPSWGKNSKGSKYRDMNNGDQIDLPETSYVLLSATETHKVKVYDHDAGLEFSGKADHNDLIFDKDLTCKDKSGIERQQLDGADYELKYTVTPIGN